MTTINSLYGIILILIVITIVLAFKLNVLHKRLSPKEINLVGLLKDDTLKFAKEAIHEVQSDTIVKFNADEKDVFVDNIVDTVIYNLGEYAVSEIQNIVINMDKNGEYKTLSAVVKGIIEDCKDIDLNVIFKTLMRPNADTVDKENDDSIKKEQNNDSSKPQTTNILSDLNNIIGE